MRYAKSNGNLTADALAATRADVLCGVKVCTSCKTRKSLDAFPIAKAGLGGAASWCKSCMHDYGTTHRLNKQETDVVFRVNKAILKRQSYGTDVCRLDQADAYRAAAHLMDEYGMMSVENGHTFKTVFMSNLPEKRRAVEAQAAAAAVERERRSDAQQAKAEARRAEKIAKRGLPRTMDITNVNLERLVLARVQRHLKKRRRKGATEFSFTQSNFTAITGYTPRELRKHLHQHMPEGAAWEDVVSGAVHIEHTTPSAAFDLSTLSSVRQCYSLSNLTLMWADENAAKGASSDKATVVHFRSDLKLAQLFGLAE